MTKRVLVTGATGFVGGEVASFLRERGFELHAIGRGAPDDPRFAFHEADLLVSDQVDAVMAAVRPTHLLHLAWYAEPGVYWRSEKNLAWVAATLHLAQAFVKSGGQRAVVAGTCAEYLWGADRFTEARTPCVPATLYGAAKDGTRRILEAYFKTVGVPFAWGRIFYIYGPGEKTGRLISDAIRTLHAGARFPTSEGKQKRDFLHVKDVAAALVTILDGSVEGPINIGSGSAVSVKSILDAIGETIGRSDLLEFGAKTLSPSEPMSIEADNTRLYQEVGFEPCYSLDSGLSDTIAWWKQHPSAK